MSDLTVIILTYNEEKNIAECINSVKAFASRIVVVDSFSNDKTIEIAEDLGAEVYQNKFLYNAQQTKWAIDNIPINTKWIMRLDADERFTDMSRKELQQLLETHSEDDVNGIILRFEIIFLNKKLKHGGVYPFKKLVVFKNGLADIEDKGMDEHFYLLKGKSVTMKNDCKHADYKDIYTWIDKHNKYSTKESCNSTNSQSKEIQYLDKSSKRKNVIKYSFYYKLPLFIRAKLYYWYRMYIKFAWLDGREGKIFAFLQAYWYRYLVDVKLYEDKKQKRD